MVTLEHLAILVFLVILDSQASQVIPVILVNLDFLVIQVLVVSPVYLVTLV